MSKTSTLSLMLRHYLCSPEKHSMHLQKVSVQSIQLYSLYFDRRLFHRLILDVRIEFLSVVCYE